jgi:hypothetical protein
MSCDETFMTAGIVEDCFESIVRGRQIRVIITTEKFGSEISGGLEHLLQDRCPHAFGVTLDGLPNFRQQLIEATGDLLRRSLQVQKFGSLADEAVKEPHVTGGGIRQIQRNVDMLGELAQQKR